MDCIQFQPRLVDPMELATPSPVEVISGAGAFGIVCGGSASPKLPVEVATLKE